MKNKIVLITIMLVAILFPISIHLAHSYLKMVDPIKNVKDYNRDLTNIAKTGLPIIEKIIEFHSSGGKYPSIEQVREMVHDPRLSSNSNSDFGNSVVYTLPNSPGVEQGWSYAPLSINDHVVGFFLRNDFSLTELLTYKYMDGKGEWIYQVNEINEKVIKLNP